MVHSVGWSSVPAIMNTWFDLTILPRVAYKYSPVGKVMKLLAEKSAKVFATSRESPNALIPTRKIEGAHFPFLLSYYFFI